jgi:hypothetical protein
MSTPACRRCMAVVGRTTWGVMRFFSRLGHVAFAPVTALTPARGRSSRFQPGDELLRFLAAL